jgi:hypothetical protein
MKSEPVMLPPPPRQELRKELWECAELHHMLDTKDAGFPRNPRTTTLVCVPPPASQG